MNLYNFEKYIEDIILYRGYDYYTDGRVVHLEKTGDRHIRARVEGTKVYTVEVSMGDADEIINSSCDCPYDMGEFCKHQVALFYMLRAGSEKVKKAGPVNRAASKLDSILGKLDRDELVSIIRSICSEYREIEKELLLEYAEQEDEIAASKKVIREYINQAEQSGFVTWNRTGLAMTGAYSTLVKAEKNLDREEYHQAVKLCQVVLSIVVDVLQYCDDSDGVVGDVINESIGIIKEAATVGIQQMKLSDQKKLFTLILKEALHKRYDGWDDWRYELLQACSYFSSIPELRRKLEQELDSKLEKLNDDKWSSKYQMSKIKLIQLSIIESCDGEKAADRFIKDNIYLNEFREKAVEKAFAQGNYGYMLQLCIEGEEIDRDYAGLVHKWREYRFAAYEKLGDKKNQRQLAYDFVMKGEFDYYTKLKNLYSDEQWQILLEDLLDKFEKAAYQPDIYVRIIIEENMTERILHYCQRHPEKVMQLYKYLVKDYMSELNDIFMSFIRCSASKASNRKDYKRVCGIINLYQETCGEINAHRLISEMRQTYPRRSAFMDELTKIK